MSKLFNFIGYLVGIAIGLAYVVFAIWRMFIIGAFIAFFRLTFSDK